MSKVCFVTYDDPSKQPEIIDFDRAIAMGMRVLSSRSCAYDTEDELREELGLEEDCASCGVCLYSTDYRENSPEFQVMKENHFCFTCAYWTIRAQYANSSSSVRVNGVQYQFRPSRYGDLWLNGFSGQEWIIRSLVDGSIRKTNNLWHNGDIPAVFRDRLPDNCEFLTRGQLAKLEAENA